MAICACFAAVILIIFFDGLVDVDDADAIDACTFLLCNGYHGVLPYSLAPLGL